MGTWSKMVKYLISTFILRCYYVAARFSLRLTRARSCEVLQRARYARTGPSRLHHELTTFSLRPSTLTSAAAPNQTLQKVFISPLTYTIEERLWTRQSILRHPGEIEEELFIFHPRFCQQPVVMTERKPSFF